MNILVASAAAPTSCRRACATVDDFLTVAATAVKAKMAGAGGGASAACGWST